MKRASSVPGRRHKMVEVDADNPFFQDYFPRWLAAHVAALGSLRAGLAGWAAAARADEAGRAAAEGRPPRPLAAVFDIDEVLLCNIHLNGASDGSFHVADFFADPATGGAWPRGSVLDPPYPGARELLLAAAESGVRPFFVTGRTEAIRDETVESFRRAAFVGPPGPPFFPLREEDLAPPAAGGGLFMLDEPALRQLLGRGVAEVPATGVPPGVSIRPFKEGVRKNIAENYRIILNVGDQMSDLGHYGDQQYYLHHPFYHTP